MIDFRLPIDLPSIDLSTALPLLTLIIIAALILITLLARSIVRSKLIAMAVIIAVVMGGGSVIVGGLQALTGLLAVAGLLTITLLVVIARHPELHQLVRNALETRRAPILSNRPHLIDQPTQLQLPTAGHEAMRSTHRAQARRLPRSLGF